MLGTEIKPERPWAASGLGVRLRNAQCQEGWGLCD